MSDQLIGTEDYDEYAKYWESQYKASIETNKLKARILDKKFLCTKGPNKDKKYRVFEVEMYPYIGGYVHIKNLFSDETHYLRANLFNKYFEEIKKIIKTNGQVVEWYTRQFNIY